MVSNLRQLESYYSDKLAQEVQGEREVKTPVGRIDVLSQSEIIEVKTVEGWKCAIGQVLAYSRYYPGLTKRIHLFGECTHEQENLMHDICAEHGIKMTLERNRCLIVKNLDELSDAPPPLRILLFLELKAPIAHLVEQIAPTLRISIPAVKLICKTFTKKKIIKSNEAGYYLPKGVKRSQTIPIDLRWFDE